MKTFKNILVLLWFSLTGIASPFWVGITYMFLTGHGKGYAYDMRSEADIAVLLGIVLLVLWLLAVLPTMISLCIKCFRIKKAYAWLPLLAFVVFFAIGVCLLGWEGFIGLFGYRYTV